LDHSYLVGNLTNAKVAEAKALESLNRETVVSAIFELVNFSARCELSKITFQLRSLLNSRVPHPRRLDEQIRVGR
jgi:hypothetical protein